MIDPPRSPSHAPTTRPTGPVPQSPTTADLQLALAEDDARENAGMHGNDRRTCHSCRTWATPEHIDSPAHKAVIAVPRDWAYDARAGYFRPRDHIRRYPASSDVRAAPGDPTPPFTARASAAPDTKTIDLKGGNCDHSL